MGAVSGLILTKKGQNLVKKSFFMKRLHLLCLETRVKIWGLRPLFDLKRQYEFPLWMEVWELILTVSPWSKLRRTLFENTASCDF